jgi:hypothetical protein
MLDELLGSLCDLPSDRKNPPGVGICLSLALETTILNAVGDPGLALCRRYRQLWPLCYDLGQSEGLVVGF